MKYLKTFILGGFVFSLILMAQETGGVVTRDPGGEKLVTVHAEDAYLPSILSILAKESGYNIVTDPNVNRQEQLTIHLDDVPIQQAINLVVRAVGLSYEIVGNSFLIAEPKKLAEEVGITSHVVELKYADAMELKDLLQVSSCRDSYTTRSSYVSIPSTVSLRIARASGPDPPASNRL